jgi:hypothetical protein
MPIPHPIDNELLYASKEASAWYRERGLKISPGTLDKKRSKGGGPRFIEIGRLRFYRESALHAYLLSRLSGEFSNTSEMKAARSVAPPNGGGI